MYEFGKIRWKNAMSYGNAWSEFDFSSGEIVLLTGKNGSGKSTLIEVLHWVLFDEPFRKIKKGSLVNSINERDMVVEFDLVANGKKVSIKKGEKPRFFDVTVDGVMMPKHAKARDSQLAFEKDVLKLTSRTFSQIGILGAATFTPFMQLPGPARRTVIEDILSIGDVGNLLEVSKRLSSNCRSRISDSLDAQTRLDERLKGKIELLEMSRRHDEESKREASEKLGQIVEFWQKAKTEIQDCEMQLDSLVAPSRSDIESKRLELQELAAKIRESRQDVERLRRKLTEVDTCDRCGKNFGELTQEQKDDVDRKIQELLATIDESTETGILVKEEYENLIAESNAHSSDVSRLNATIANGKKFIENCKAEAKKCKLVIDAESTDVRSIEDELIELKAVVRENSIKIERLRTELVHRNGVTEIFKDEGVKTRIIKAYLPIINRLVNENLAILDFPASFHLDETFEETIKSRHRDNFSYFSFSEGEKKRIDLALLFAWREIAKTSNSANMNILVLDEVADGALDAEGVRDFNTLLTKTCGKDTTIVVMSHNPELVEKFSAVCTMHVVAEKRNGFSELNVVEL